MIFLQLTVEGYDNNFTYIIGDEETKNAIIIDPAGSNEKVENKARDNGLRIKYIINTHSHEDHTIGNNYFLKNWSFFLNLPPILMPIPWPWPQLRR